MKSRARDPRTIERVRALYKEGCSSALIARKLHTSETTVIRIAKENGIQRTTRSSGSTKHRVLREAVRKNNKKPVRRGATWEPGEEAWLIEHEKTLTVEEAAIHLKRSSDAIRMKMKSLGVRLRFSIAWSPSDDDFIKSNFHEKSITHIAQRLDRGYHAVRKRALKLGLGVVSDQVTHRVTVADIALRLGVSESAAFRWFECNYFPNEKIGRWHTTDDTAVTEWLEAGNILRADRATLDYRDRLMYDRVRAEYYRIIDVWALDIPALRYMHSYARDDEARRLIPKALHASEGRNAERGYYRKRDVWAWCYYVGHALPNDIADPDIADVQTAWLTEFVTPWELRDYFTSDKQNYWSTHKGFPSSVVKSRAYRRAEVVAWLRANGFPHIAQKLTRGAVLCYDELIRDRQRRELR